jgi:cell division septal protein FtsQ
VFGKKRKTRQNFSLGGYKKYRKTLVFRTRPTKPKKEFVFPRIPFKLIALICVVILAVYYLFLSGKFAVREVIVEGNKMVPTEKVQASIPKGKNILYLNVKKTKKDILENNPEIKNLEIYRGLPDAVKVVVLEHEGKMLWRNDSGTYLISSHGQVAKRLYDGEAYDFPIVIDKKNIPVEVGSNLLSPSFIAFINNIYGQFFNATNIKPLTFEVDETTFDVNLMTEAGFYVKLNSLRSSQKQLENLKKVLVEKRDLVHEYVDLRIDGWAYFK